ncbi:MAG TPA: RNA polymerase sigma factor [Ktedonobacteraceae bacterium]|nr:RNA polymerase sigma factor [Ktedonobacteraceae bacterium]
MEIDSTDLRAQLANDIHQGFANVVIGYQHQLYAFLLRRLGNPQEAEDIVQETLLQAYYTLKCYSAERIRLLALRAWLYKIAHNVSMNAMRRNKLPVVSLETLEDTSWLEQEEESAQPERVLEELESRQELEALIQHLPAQYAETVMLYYFEHFSYQEIAYVLDCPPGTVRSYRHRGIQFLRKALLAQTPERRPEQNYHARPS